MELTNAILLGDCLDILRQIPDETFHAVVTDVPYGLGNKEPTPEEILLFVQGKPIKTGDFMGNDWDIPSVEVWKEVYRVLKPGGYVLSFGGTRTWDLISIGLRMAGFENRDTIADEFPALQWFHGQGMPKSHNVSKAIDKKAGAKREVVGVKPGHEEFVGRSTTGHLNSSSPNSSLGGFDRPWMHDEEAREQYHLQTAPATPEAKLWDGYGTGLKPCWEPIVVFRKPFQGTVADNVLRHGTGAMNIDGCRVRHASKADFEAHKAQVEAVKSKGGVRDGSWKNASDLSGASDVTEAGRWPTNAVLAHHPDCRKVGTEKVPSRANGPLSDNGEDGTETIEAWECVPGCPVAALDEQSGNRPSMLTGRADPGQVHEHPGEDKSSKSTFLGEDREHLSRVYADDGGASRFFPQFEGDQTPEGRWPPNAMLTHHPDCRRVGVKKVKSHNPDNQSLGRTTKDVYGKYAERSLTHHASEDGTEEVEAWECVEGCPIKALDEQSGQLTSGTGAVKKASSKGYQGDAYGKENRPEGTTMVEYGDSGGASRFFPQFEGEQTPEGRWPPNATLTHHPDCKIVGYQKVDAPVINRFDDGAKPFGDGAGHPYTSTQTGDSEGKEEVPIWECVEGCPIKELDEQSLARGMHTAGNKKTVTSTSSKTTNCFGERERLPENPDFHGDSGGASRFFEQFQAPEVPFMYTAKPSKRETSLDGEIKNNHPTKKPLELMRWLVRLVTFKGAHVLDPYCGSGTTLHAAAEEGVIYTGIERDPHAHSIATHRMDIVLGREKERQSEFDAFDLAMELGDEEDP